MKTDALSIAISGLKSASRRVGVASNNIANLQSEGFKRDVPVQVELSTGGSAVSTVKDNSPGSPVFTGSRNGAVENGQTEGSNVSIETEMVELIRSRSALSAAVKTIRANYENVGAILDIKS